MAIYNVRRLDVQKSIVERRSLTMMNAVHVAVVDATIAVSTTSMAMNFGRNHAFNARAMMVQWIVNIIERTIVHNYIAIIHTHRRIIVVRYATIVIIAMM